MKHAIIYTLFILTLTACSQDCVKISKTQWQKARPECDIFYKATKQACKGFGPDGMLTAECIKKRDEAIKKCSALLGVKRPAGIKSACPQQTTPVKL